MDFFLFRERFTRFVASKIDQFNNTTEFDQNNFRFSSVWLVTISNSLPPKASMERSTKKANFNSCVKLCLFSHPASVKFLLLLIPSKWIFWNSESRRKKYRKNFCSLFFPPRRLQESEWIKMNNVCLRCMLLHIEYTKTLLCFIILWLLWKMLLQ